MRGKQEGETLAAHTAEGAAKLREALASLGLTPTAPGMKEVAEAMEPTTYAHVVETHALIARAFDALYGDPAQTDDSAIEALFALRAGDVSVHPAVLDSLRDSPQGSFMVLWACRWRSLAFPSVEIHDPKLAASLICTSAGPDAAEHFEPPWDAFLLRLPEGAFMVPRASDGQLENLYAVRVMRMRLAEGGERWTISGSGPTTQWWTRGMTRSGMLDDAGMPDLGHHGDEALGFSLPLDDEDGRIMVATRRLVRNVVLWMTDPERRRAAEHRPSRKAQRARAHARGERVAPLSRYVMTAPVRIDARPAVQAFLRGDRSSPAVRSLVRGFWRRQVHGQGRALRRLQWIDPYWRGGEALPIAVRTHVAGPPPGEPPQGPPAPPQAPGD